METATVTAVVTVGTAGRPVEDGGHVVGEVEGGLADVDGGGRVGGVVGGRHGDELCVVRQGDFAQRVIVERQLQKKEMMCFKLNENIPGTDGLSRNNKILMLWITPL